MSLTSVKMSEEVWFTCLAHALTTETEEIMGLLLGDIQYFNGGNSTAIIWGASPQMRSDRRKDRVETNPELLAAASAQAERMTLTTGRTTRVIGWYHSHPHITVLPSHVDVRTQAMYQLLDPGFIGLIFSCFNSDARKVGRIQVIAFQSLDGKRRLVSPVITNSIIEVESSWSSSENVLSTSGSALTESNEQDTATRPTKLGGRSSDLEEFFSHADASHRGKQQPGENSLVVYNPDNIYNNAVNMDAGDMTPSMQEALHRSNMEVSGAEYVRKEVPLHVLPTRYLLKLESPLASFTDMQRVLFEEERSAYNQAMHQNMRDGKVHPLTYIHHSSMYQASLCKLMEYCLSPAVAALQDRLKENEVRLALLLEEAKLLESEPRSSEIKKDSPRRLSSQGFHGGLLQKDVHASGDQVSSRSPKGTGSSRRKPS